jgi:integrase
VPNAEPNAAGFPWATGDTFRKTVATLLDAAGTSGREVANQLGHVRPSMTMDVYMDRTTITEAAAVLERRPKRGAAP